MKEEKKVVEIIDVPIKSKLPKQSHNFFQNLNERF